MSRMDEESHTHLLDIAENRFESVYRLIYANGVAKLKTRRDRGLFDFLAKVVTGQQLSNRAAQTIFSRIDQKAADYGKSLQEFVAIENQHSITSCGLSRYKFRAMIELKGAFEEGRINEGCFAKLNHLEITEKITSIWGFGQWSADMAAIFFFGLPDVWSDGDISLQKGFTSLTGLSSDMSSNALPIFSPFRSYLALHIWKGIDDGVI